MTYFVLVIVGAFALCSIVGTVVGMVAAIREARADAAAHIRHITSDGAWWLPVLSFISDLITYGVPVYVLAVFPVIAAVCLSFEIYGGADAWHRSRRYRQARRYRQGMPPVR